MKRNKLFDSLKFVLIFLMVYGHTLQYNSGHIVDTIFGFIYTFHMPLFIFISGYFSKNITWEKYKKSFISLIITFTIFQFIYSFPIIFTGFKNWIIFFIKPKGWYIIGLLVWRFLFLIAKDKVSKVSFLLISFLFPLGVGFLDTEIFMFRILTFFPYFLLGAFCKEVSIVRIRNINKLYAILFLVVVFISIYFIVNKEFLISLFGEDSYIKNYSTRYKGFLYRILAYVLAITVSIGIINVIPDTLGKYGSKTLEIYLMHHIIINFLYVGLFPLLNFNPNLLLNLGVTAIIVITCLYLATFKIVKFIMSPLDYFKKIIVHR